MKLINPTNTQLNVAFAEYIAKWPKTEINSALHWGVDWFGPTYTNSADIILPWLEKLTYGGTIMFLGHTPKWRVQICMRNDLNFEADAESFARAAVIALLRAHGVEIEFTK